MKEFYPREVLTPRNIQKLIEIFEDEQFLEFTDVFGSYEMTLELIQFIRDNFHDLRTYDDTLFTNKYPCLTTKEIIDIIEEWFYDVISFSSQPELSKDYSMSVLSRFINKNEIAMNEFIEFFTYGEDTSSGTWMDDIFNIKKRFDEYLESDGKR